MRSIDHRSVRASAAAILAGLACAAILVVVLDTAAHAGTRSRPIAALPRRAGRAHASRAELPIYRNRHDTFAERAADLVARMTLAEKGAQTDSSVSPAIPRLGVPQWSWWNEALHGVAREGFANGANPKVLTNTTSYPDDQSLGSTWDPSLIYSVASQISSEAREVVTANTDNLDFYSPTMNLERDPRWGRTDEAYGEDPLLVSREVSAYVDGLQGETPAGRLPASAHGYLKTIATIKHFTAYNDEDNRLTGSSDEDARTLREYDTAPFASVIAAAHPGSVMSSYNEVDGTPSPVDEFLNQSLLRETFGLTGYLTSDCDAVYEITAGHHWRPPGYSRPATVTERAALANATGEDLNCNEGYHDAYDYADTLPADTTEQIPTTADTYNVQDLDTSLVRLFTARMRTGEFDPSRDVPWVTQARRALPRGTWTSSNANHAVTETPARLALARRAGDESIVLLKNAGADAPGATGTLLPLQVPSSGAYRIAVVGSFAHPDPSDLYLGDYSSIQARAGQAHDVDAYTGIRDEVRGIDPAARVDYIRGFTGDGQTTPGSVAHVDSAALRRIRDGGYDAVIVVAGTDGSLASKSCVGCGTESSNRTALTLPGAQNALIKDVAAINPHTIAYLQTLGPMDVSAFAPDVSAILWSSYDAQRQGQALADVLTGAVDPSGRLSATWYRSLRQIPEPVSDYAIRPSGKSPGRTYEYYDGAKGPVAYPFGYGLSYTTYAVSGPRLSATRLGADGTLHASAQVTNTGTRAGREVVQLYVGQPHAPAARRRPIRRLEGFASAQLAAGQTKTVHFTIRIPALAYWDTMANHWALDDGAYSVQVATSSAASATRLRRDITVHGRLTPQLSVVTAQPVMGGDPARGVQQRVMFPQDVTVHPQLTVSMSTGTLYGDEHRGAGRPLPAGTRVSYRSDHPGVVSVRGGRIRTRGDGVATVTVTVRRGGVTRTTSFVVCVLSQLSALRVGGREVAGFHPDTGNYEVVVPRGRGVPRLSAISPDHRASVSIRQPAAVPGTGKVTITGPDGVVTSYAVHLAHPARSDAFDASGVGAQWSWVDRDPATERVSGGALRIREQPGALTGAVLGDTGTPVPTRPLRNVLLQPALGAWTTETRLTLGAVPRAKGSAAGILAYEDPGDYLSLGWEDVGHGPQLVETVCDTRSGSPVSATLAVIPTASVSGHTVWLKMRRRGSRYTTWYSTDGRTFQPIGTFGASLTGDRVGVFAGAGTATHDGPSASFGEFRVTGGG